MNVLVAGASGNLGSRLCAHLLERGFDVRMLVHRHAPLASLAAHPHAVVVSGDLARPETLPDAVRDVEAIVHVAGVLFQPRPERFLERTNVGFVDHLATAAAHAGVKKYVLISFPHVEGETTPDHPAKGSFKCNVDVSHFQTRLQAERRLLAIAGAGSLRPLILRTATVYGPGMKLIEGARWLFRYRMMAVWKDATWLHLLALPDFLSAVEQGLSKDVVGVIGVGDEAPLLLQEFLDRLAAHWGYGRPRRLPKACFIAAAAVTESAAQLFGTSAPLTRDFMKAGFVSSVADIGRMKSELLTTLAYPTFAQGIELLRVRNHE